MNIIKNTKEIELKVDGKPFLSIIEKDTMFQLEKVDEKIVLKEIDEENQFLFGGKYITLSLEQWDEHKFNFINL